MSGALIFITFCQAFWNVVSTAVAEQPLLTFLTLGWAIGAGVTVGQALDRRGWSATAWGAVTASFFAIWLVIAPSAAT